MKIISGGQTGVDRAALDVAIERGMSWGGWCPKGGWAEDFPDPPGLLNRYPNLRETPLSQPEQRTEWNVRDSDAILIIVDREGLAVSRGTTRAREWADHYGKPLLIIDVGQPDAAVRVAQWLRAQRNRFGARMTLGVGGPRESEAPGIYTSARELIAAVLDHVWSDEVAASQVANLKVLPHKKFTGSTSTSSLTPASAFGACASQPRR